ncbi:AfsR/SARP family transcriptional regulator [Nonomuraea sp. NPDC005983]|uniref:AfsR/SARP family transcriptional regulator n=1 Tax=Nonomuraea sp. NPDC005983 TaxID=3155595 RepID=UPI0033B53F9A
MRIEVLGPMEAWDSGVSVLPSAGKPRQILALLALNHGRLVTSATLAEELWHDKVPRSVNTTLQTYILQLRRKLDTARGRTGKRTGKDLLVTRHSGYQLQLCDDELDTSEHERLIRAGAQAVEAHDDARASTLLAQALSLWRGTPLVDVPIGPQLELEVMRLEQLHLSAVEMWIETELRLGRHHGLLSELAVLCAQHPLNETLQTGYMLALYRAGRQWQALDVYQRLHTVLRRELRVEPSGRTQQLMRAIAASDPVLDHAPHQMIGVAGSSGMSKSWR